MAKRLRSSELCADCSAQGAPGGTGRHGERGWGAPGGSGGCWRGRGAVGDRGALRAGGVPGSPQRCGCRCGHLEPRCSGSFPPFFLVTKPIVPRSRSPALLCEARPALGAPLGAEASSGGSRPCSGCCPRVLLGLHKSRACGRRAERLVQAVCLPAPLVLRGAGVAPRLVYSHFGFARLLGAVPGPGPSLCCVVT